VMYKYNLFVQELKKYIVLQIILHFCVECHGVARKTKKNLVMYSNVGSKIELHGG